MKKKLVIVCAILASWFFIHSLVITIDGLTDDFAKADCILILGNTVNPDGTLSERLQARVDKGLQLYLRGYSRKVIVSGGLGKEGYHEGTEMQNYLLAKGVRATDIIVDNEGRNTGSTVNFFSTYAHGSDLKSVIVVSQFFHLSRTKCAIERKGDYKVYTAHAEYYEIRDLYALFREFFAYYKYLLISN